jgi:hypothetical protein
VDVRKTAIALAILIIVALAGLYLAPKLYDFDRYRPTVAEWASKALGRPVTLAGTMSLELLPSPHIAVRDVRIANPPGARAPELARVSEISAAVSFWPLLAGRIEVTSARLVRPVIVLERLPQQAVPSPAPGGAAESARTPTPPPTASRVKIARLTIEDGTIAYSGEAFGEALDHVSLAIVGDGVTAPLRVEGGFSRRGMPVTITADLGRLGNAEVPLSLVLSSRGLGSIETSGALSDLGSAPRFSGKLTLKGDDLGAVAARAGVGPLPPPLARPFHVTGDLAASAAGATLDGIVIDVGDLHGTGALSATPGDPLALAAKLAVDSVDLDRFLAERPPPSGAAPPAATSSPPTTARADTPRFDLPTGIAASIDFGAGAVVWRQGVLRQLRVEASLGGGKLAVKRAGVLLPGGSDVVVSGELDTVAGLPRFAGTLNANADNLRDFLRWSGVAVEGVPPDRLRRAALQSRIEVDGAVMQVRSIDLGVDAARITGAATVALRDRLAFGARLAIDQLNLDAYLTEDRAPSTPGRIEAGPAATAAIRVTVPAAAASALASIDANLDVAISALIWRGQPIRELHFTGTLQNRDLTLRELSVGDLGGARGKLSGYLQGIGGDAPKAQVAFDMRGPELSRVLRLLAPKIASAETFGEFSLGGEVVREGGRLSLDAEVEALGGKLHAAGDTPAADTWSLTLSLDHPSFNRLARLASPGYRPAGGELGAVKLRGVLEWAPESVVVHDLRLAVDTMTLGGDFRLALAGRPMLTASLDLGDLALDRFLPVRQTASLDDLVRPPLRPGVMLAQAGAPRAAGSARWSRTPLDLSFLRLFDAEVSAGGTGLAWANWRLGEPKASLALGNGVLEIKTLSGRLFGGALSASGRVDAAGEPKLDLQAKLAGADLRQALSAAGTSRIEGAFDVDASLASSGASAFDLVSRLAGKASLQGHDGAINGVDLAAIDRHISQMKGLGDLAALLRAATSGSTRFSRLDGSFVVADGVARSEDLHLLAEGGEGTGMAIVDFPNWTLQSRTDIRLTGVEGAPPLGIQLRGSLDQPDLAIDLSALTKALGSGGEGGGLGKPKDILKDLLKRVK